MAVDGDDVRHLQAANGRRARRVHARQNFRPPTGLERAVDPVVVMGTNQSKQGIQQFGRFFSGLDHHVQKIEAGQNAVALRHMTTKRVPTAFLAPDHGVHFHHFGSNKFKTDAGFMHRHAVELA